MVAIVVTERSKVREVALVAALLLLAAGLRFAALGGESCWFDEIESARLSDGGMAEVLHDSAASVHPPLYFALLHVWRGLAGSSDASLRTPSALASLAGLLALYLLARDLGGRRAAWFALLLGVVDPLDIYYAREARMYAQAAALATCAAWLLWRFLGSDDDTRRVRLAIGYAVCSVALLYTHYLGALLLLAQGLFALGWLGRRRQWRWLLAYLGVGAAAALLFLPWICYVRSLRPTLYASAQMDWMPLPRLSDGLLALGREPFWGLAGENGRSWPAATAVLPVLVAGLLALELAGGRRDGHSPARAGLAYAVVLLVVPVGLAIAVSHLYQPVYYPPRFSLLVLPPFLVLAALACERARPRWAGAALGAALGAAMIVGSVVQARTPLKTDWRGLAEAWPQDAAPAELVCFPPFIAYCVSHYLGRPLVADDPDTVLRALPRLEGRELWVVASYDYPFRLRPEDAATYRRLLALGPRRSLQLASAWRLDRVRVGWSAARAPAQK